MLLPSANYNIYCTPFIQKNSVCAKLEMLGFEPRTFRMQSERSTAELHPQMVSDHRDNVLLLSTDLF